jgi:hypothetical protein
MRVIVSFDTEDCHHDPHDSTYVTAWFHSALTDALLMTPTLIDDIDIVSFSGGEQVSATELVEQWLTDQKGPRS